MEKKGLFCTWAQVLCAVVAGAWGAAAPAYIAFQAGIGMQADQTRVCSLVAIAVFVVLMAVAFLLSNISTKRGNYDRFADICCVVAAALALVSCAVLLVAQVSASVLSELILYEVVLLVLCVCAIALCGGRALVNGRERRAEKMEQKARKQLEQTADLPDISGEMPEEKPEGASTDTVEKTPDEKKPET